MHLWPSSKVRESFKVSYMENYERNLQRMKLAKQSSSMKRRLLERGGDGVEAADLAQGSQPTSTLAVWGRDLWMLLSACRYCCFAFGASPDQES